MTDCNPSLPTWAQGKVAVDPDSGCWVWTGTVLNTGYGQARTRCSCGETLRSVPAHRAVYLEMVGPIPDGLHLDHICRNRACVNPAHLEPVTNRENTVRGTGPTALNAAKTHCVNGHPLSGANLRVRSDGTRQCRACVTARRARPEARAKARTQQRNAKRNLRLEKRGGAPARMGPDPAINSPEALEAIASRYAAGESADAVGRALGISGATILRTLHRHGIPTRRPGGNHAPGGAS